MPSKSTRLRWFASSDKELLQATVNALPTKVEIKALGMEGAKWVIWFVVPEPFELESADLD